MSSVIPSDIHINEAILARVLKDQFNLIAKSIILLGEGFDNVVYLVNDQWVFRLPRREIAVQLVATEMHILPLLQHRLPLKIPKPIFFGAPCPDFPRPFYGHELIAGDAGSKVILNKHEYTEAAHDLANFLRTLHSIGVDDLGFPASSLSPVVDRSEYHALKNIFDKRLKSIRSHYDFAPYQSKLDQICETAKYFKQHPENRVFVHGDIYHRHLIFDQQKKLTGIIDWGDCAIADKVSDLGIAFQFFPKQIRPIFFSTYGSVDEQTVNYARFIGLYYAIALLWFGHDRKDRDLIRTSLWTIAEI